ncbi:MAG TPA: hypothetical protein VEC16_01910 [Alphaproteobacteria bacterium]|nr:hypothetical protein [Alphaproteobacteria bacterium]
MNINNFRKNRKGNVVTDNMANLILMAVIIGIGIYFLWAYVLHGAGDSIDAVQQCGALTGSKGVCKESCDLSAELEFTNLGCKGIANKCCIPKNENMDDVILPAGYGGNTEYDFEVISIDFDSVGSCKKDPDNNGIILCEPGEEHEVVVIIDVKNIYGETLTYGDAVVVINGNAKNIRGPGRYTGPSIKFTTGKTDRLRVNLEISAADAKNNDYWTIYPYATCTTAECKSTDTGRARGILSSNDDDSVTIKFTN